MSDYTMYCKSSAVSHLLQVSIVSHLLIYILHIIKHDNTACHKLSGVNHRLQ